MGFVQKLKKELNWQKPVKLHIDLNTELYVQLAPFKLPLILTVLMMLFGALDYIIIDDFPLMDAIYQNRYNFYQALP